ncbi:hypothetical protein D1BOALGB6SA_5936 [Olavius sp. associated proteobacterium Delta 1]|nr:hypothetical protein D1BOALGB6SA_5936 [Olavius sp. associated proteobacterium Delta 1]
MTNISYYINYFYNFQFLFCSPCDIIRVNRNNWNNSRKTAIL